MYEEKSCKFGVLTRHGRFIETLQAVAFQIKTQPKSLAASREIKPCTICIETLYLLHWELESKHSSHIKFRRKKPANNFIFFIFMIRVVP